MKNIQAGSKNFYPIKFDFSIIEFSASLVCSIQNYLIKPLQDQCFPKMNR